MNTVIVNGKSYTFSGSNISIRNGDIIANGKSIVITEDKVITININGNIENLEVDNCNSISVVGQVGSIETTNGDVDISGNVL